MKVSDTGDAIDSLERLCARDVGRGIESLAAAARGGLRAAATAIAEHPGPHVALLTGFYVPEAEPPAAETDGPPGTAHLAAALVRAGIPVRLVTDDLCAGAVKAAASAAGVPPEVPFDIVPLAPTEQEIGALLTQWRTARVSHAIAVERVGPSSDGVCRNMRGKDITTITAPLERLFDGGPWVRIGIGDGGNEIGMGALPLSAFAPAAGRVACRVGCDHLVVCGVSNWGAWALAAALGLLRSDWQAQLSAGRSVERERRILEATVLDGPAVDGITCRQALSVDNLPWEQHAELLAELWRAGSGARRS